MKLTKEEARNLIEYEIKINGLPIYDKVLYESKTDNENITYTFRFLLMFIYDLKERL